MFFIITYKKRVKDVKKRVKDVKKLIKKIKVYYIKIVYINNISVNILYIIY
jgi:ABC-type Fe3+-hydroxamate transport system substrate-binding protein